jgi:hypothetical protein
MGRPKSANKKTNTVQLRMDDAERAAFDRLVAARDEELSGEGLEITGPDVLRWLIKRELAARGLDKTPAAAPHPASKPKKAKPAP